MTPCHRCFRLTLLLQLTALHERIKNKLYADGSRLVTDLPASAGFVLVFELL